MKKKQKTKIYYSAGLLVVLCIIAGTFLFSNRETSESSKKSLSNLDSFGKYSGTNDTKDGIVLSACNSTIISPTNGQVLDHSLPVTFHGNLTHDGAAEIPSRVSWNKNGWAMFPNNGPYTMCPYYAWWVSGYVCCDTINVPVTCSSDFYYTASIDKFYQPGEYRVAMPIHGRSAENTTCTGTIFTTGVHTSCGVTFSTGWKLTTGVVNSPAGSGYVISNSINYSSPASISCSSGTGGSGCSKVVKAGDWIALAAVANPGYKFKKWNNVAAPINGSFCNGDGNFSGHPLQCGGYPMDNDYTITAEFEQTCDCSDSIYHCVGQSYTACGNTCTGTMNGTCSGEENHCQGTQFDDSCGNPTCVGTNTGCSSNWKEVAP